ncbi:MAG: 5'-nucleotidase C-terminal domain-containing protein, partial [Acidimicrobiia bacterium]|nr:5'-nucleotidase C-terminal domain-containing protein [Acidimicrobiia bacterium]
IEDVSPDQMKVIFENAVSRVESSSGRFAQIAGMTLVYDPAGTPQEIGEDDTITTEGSRVQSITLDDGTAIVSDGAVVDGAPSIALVTLNFLATGGDQYLFGDGTRTHLGLTDQQSLAAYIKDGLNGTISAAQYPEGGEGRITVVADEMADDMGDGMADDMDDGMADDMDGVEETTGEELPATGVESSLLFIIAAAMIIAGLLLASLTRHLNTARRRKRLSI